MHMRVSAFFCLIYNIYSKDALLIIVKYSRYAILCLILGFIGLTTNVSCVKEVAYLEDNGAKLRFSCDTVAFDTVFVTMGTTTQQVLVYNTYDNPILLTRVAVRGGASSRFRINVDGDTSLVVSNITIPAHDSIFIFVTANINPNSSSSPFLVEDAIDFDFCNAHQSLILTAYGRNAVYHTPNMTLSDQDGNLIGYASIIDCANWNHSMPHVITGIALVANGATLHLNPGEEVYMANNSHLIVLENSTLKVSGSRESPVRFTSVRHDGWYDSLPGQWGYLWFSGGSIDNEIGHAVIENGTIGILADTNVNGNPTVRITNTLIQNHQLYGILSQSCAHIEGENLLVTSCGSALVALNAGGNFHFGNSTFANFWRYGGRQVPAVAISNYYEARVNGVDRIVVRDIVRAEFDNCIIDGSFSLDGGGEVSLAQVEEGQFNVLFHNCLVKSRQAMAFSENSQVCSDVRYVAPSAYDYRPKSDSPAAGAGDHNKVILPYDLNGTLRAIPPTIGAYEAIQ